MGFESQLEPIFRTRGVVLAYLLLQATGHTGPGSEVVTDYFRRSYPRARAPRRMKICCATMLARGVPPRAGGYLMIARGVPSLASCPRSAWARGRRDGPDRATRRFAPTPSVGASKLVRDLKPHREQ